MSAAPRNARVGHASGSTATPVTADAPLLRRARTVPASGTDAAPAVSASSRALSVIGLRNARLNPALAGLSTERHRVRGVRAVRMATRISLVTSAADIDDSIEHRDAGRRGPSEIHWPSALLTNVPLTDFCAPTQRLSDRTDRAPGAVTSIGSGKI